MRKIYLLFVLLAFTFAYGCSDFLEEASQDEVKPSTVEDLEQIMLGDCYFNPNSTASGSSGANFFSITDIFTDNLQCYGVGGNAFQNTYDARDAQFLWEDNMFTENGDGDDARFWQQPYNGIGACNVVLDFLDEMIGETEYREHVRGEALVLRAYYYFHLVNFFGMPYNNGDPSVNLGVPLQLTSDVVNEGGSRNTVKEVYDQIVSDLLCGYELMKEYPMEKDHFRVGPKATAAMLSRVYLYMEDWDNAIAYADSVLREQPALLDLNDLSMPDLQTLRRAEMSVYGEDTPDEIIWMRPYSFNFYQSSLGENAKMPWAVSEEFTNLMTNNASLESLAMEPSTIEDLRVAYYFAWSVADNEYYLLAPDKPMSTSYNWGKTQGIRTAEVYLNRIEAYIHKAMEGESSYLQLALDDLNNFRRHRYAEASYEDVTTTDAEELMDIYKLERRKELAGESNHRWFDIRRFGETFTHVAFAKEDEGEQTRVLQEAQYALPIPEIVLNRNNKLIQNVRQ